MLYCRQRQAFGQPIVEYPMVQETLVDIVTEVEVGWALTARMIQLFDVVHTYGSANASDTPLLRIFLSLAKYRHSELGVTAAKRAMELHGGNGYIEEYPLARLLRDAVVNPIWEGTANIQSLEIMKNLQRGGDAAFLGELITTLDRIHRPELAPYRAFLTEETERLSAVLRRFLNEDELRQSASAKKLADWMYDIASAVRLLEETQYDVESDGNARRALILGHWIDVTLKTHLDRGILSRPLMSREVFNAITRFDCWPSKHPICP
jgi:hypothetical protein